MKFQLSTVPKLAITYSVDEEEHSDEQADVRQSLERLHECPEQNADGASQSEKFDETSRSEETQEAKESISVGGKSGCDARKQLFN